MIRLSNKLYYCNNKPVLSDEEYDILKEYIEEKYPNNKAIMKDIQCVVAVEKRKMAFLLKCGLWIKLKVKKKILNYGLKNIKENM